MVAFTGRGKSSEIKKLSASVALNVEDIQSPITEEKLTEAVLPAAEKPRNVPSTDGGWSVSATRPAS